MLNEFKKQIFAFKPKTNISEPVKKNYAKKDAKKKITNKPKKLFPVREISVLGNKYKLDCGKFPQLFYEMVNRIAAEATKDKPNILLSFKEESSYKKDNGIVLLSLTILNHDSSKAVTINFLYSEDRRIVNKEKTLETIVESMCISVINPNLCKVLFNIHGSQSIDKSEKYITRIINDNISYISNSEKK